MCCFCEKKSWNTFISKSLKNISLHNIYQYLKLISKKNKMFLSIKYKFGPEDTESEYEHDICF